MGKESTLRMEGTVTEVLPNATFKIEIEGSRQQVNGYLSGKMRQHTIKVLLGDSVEIEFSPYDLTKGRVIRRL